MSVTFRFLETETLQEIPPVSFSLADITANRAFVAQQRDRIVETIERTADYEIVRTGDGQRGWIFLLNYRLDKADYVVQYATRHWKWMSHSVTQCILWRDASSPHVQGLTARMFFGYLLSRYGTIMSDRRQTPDGNDFWRARMTTAVGLGHRVGVATLYSHTINWYRPAQDGDYQTWMIQQYAYGPEEKYQGIRYVIEGGSRNPA